MPSHSLCHAIRCLNFWWESLPTQESLSASYIHTHARGVTNGGWLCTHTTRTGVPPSWQSCPVWPLASDRCSEGCLGRRKFEVACSCVCEGRSAVITTTFMLNESIETYITLPPSTLLKIHTNVLTVFIEQLALSSYPVRNFLTLSTKASTLLWRCMFRLVCVSCASMPVTGKVDSASVPMAGNIQQTVRPHRVALYKYFLSGTST